MFAALYSYPSKQDISKDIYCAHCFCIVVFYIIIFVLFLKAARTSRGHYSISTAAVVLNAII